MNLEQTLMENGFLRKENGKKILVNKEKARDIYFEYVNNTGFLNRWVIKGYNFLKDKTEGRCFFDYGIDPFFKIYLGGSMTRRDQEAFALISEKEPWKLTVYNSLLTICLSFQFGVYIKAVDVVSNCFDSDINSFKAGAWIAGGLAVVNAGRMGLAYSKKRAYGAASLKGVIGNLPTYVKISREKF